MLPPQTPIEQVEPSPASSLFQRLVRGDVPLLVAFWGWGVVGNLACLFLVGLVNAVGVREAVAWLYLFYAVFSAVVIWRSSARYTGNRLWAVLARLAVIATIILWIIATWVAIMFMASQGH